MWRLIFVGLIIWLVIYAFKRRIPPFAKPKDAENKFESDDIEDMAQCANCAVHLPRSEAFLVNGKLYCCKAHIQNK